MTQQQLLQERMNGKLPVIKILGHPFYVDLHMGYLRPKDDFMTLGIPISSFEDFEGPNNKFWIPYDPARHELKDVDIDNLKAIPKDWVLIELPQPQQLDPYGYARKYGWDIDFILEETPILENMKAKLVDWKDSSIPEIIKENNKAAKSATTRRQPKIIKDRKRKSNHHRR